MIIPSVLFHADDPRSQKVQACLVFPVLQNFVSVKIQGPFVILIWSIFDPFFLRSFWRKICKCFCTFRSLLDYRKSLKWQFSAKNWSFLPTNLMLPTTVTRSSHSNLIYEGENPKAFRKTFKLQLYSKLNTSRSNTAAVFSVAH